MQVYGTIVIKQNINIMEQIKMINDFSNSPLFWPIFKSFIEKTKSKTKPNKNNIIGNRYLLQ